MYRPPGLAGLVVYAHNDYLQLASEMGIFALGIILWSVLSASWAGFRTFFITRSNFKRGMILGTMSGIVAILIHSFVDFNLHIPANAILFTVFVAMLMVTANRNLLIMNK